LVDTRWKYNDQEEMAVKQNMSASLILKAIREQKLNYCHQKQKKSITDIEIQKIKNNHLGI